MNFYQQNGKMRSYLNEDISVEEMNRMENDYNQEMSEIYADEMERKQLEKESDWYFLIFDWVYILNNWGNKWGNKWAF